MNCRPTIRLLPVVLAGLLSLPLQAQTPAVPATEGKTVELPKMTVTDSASLPQLESWRYGRITGFEVLSNASEKDTKKLLADFEKFQRAVRLVWPAPLKPVAAATIILCSKADKFDAFRPPGTPADGAVVPSLFLRNREQVAIVVDLQSEQVTVNDPIAALATNSNSVDYQIDHYRQLYREYVHYLLSQSDSRSPAWLEEGLAQIIMDIELTDRSLIYGKIDSYKGSASGGNPIDLEETDASASAAVVGEQPFNVVLQTRKFIPFGDFLAITTDSPEARAPLGNNLWAKQAYAFVHFCLFGDEGMKYRDPLIAFVGRLAREPLSEALFKDCFKIGYKDMEKQLRSYLRYTKHKYQKYDLQASDRVTVASIDLTEASAEQVGVIKGDALRLAHHNPAALNEYYGAYQRGSRDPAVLAGLGAVEANPGLARKFTDDAVKAGTQRPSAYVAQARMRLAEFKAEPGPDGKLTSAQMGAVLTPLFKARGLQPPLPETYETIAEAWALSAAAPKPEHLGVLDEGVRQFPRDSELLYRTATLYQQIGVLPPATSIARLGLRFATDDATKARFEKLLSTLPPPAAK
ncbi:MAG TPA: hypothetical protein VG734_22465 [Lacunisphaera sp.]|nr:hypothetical protein [Lacunisphaera sp.]